MRKIYEFVRKYLFRYRSYKIAGFMKCQGIHAINIDNLHPGWVDKKTTPGELVAIKYLLSFAGYNNKKILHVGIGNCELGKALNDAAKCEIIGITINGGEIINAQGKYKSTYVVNKYDSEHFCLIISEMKFDLIIDMNIFSYACCWRHAIRYFYNIYMYLNEGGVIVTHISGMLYAPTGIMLTMALLKSITDTSNLSIHQFSDGIVLIKKL